MKSSSAKQKGRRLVTQVVNMLLEGSNLLPDDFIRRTTGQPGEDVMMSPAARSVYPISIECKNVEKLNVYEAYKQAEDNTPRKGFTGQHIEPVVVMSKNRHPNPLVVVDAEYFFNLLRSFTK